MIRYIAFAALAAGAFGQSFEVASIRPKPFEQVIKEGAAGGAMGMEITPEQVRIAAMHMAQLIRAAYDIKDSQLEGPDWIVDPDGLPAMFEVEAKLPAGATRDQVPVMLQNLLKDRFKLAAHKGSKELDTYALIVGKDGPAFKAKETSDLPQTTTTVTQGERGEVTVVRNGTKQTITPGRGTRVEASTINGLVDYLSPLMGKPVLDKTGLTGSYNIVLQVVPTGPLPGMPTDPKELLTFLQENADLVHAPFVAAVEKLGLKLERQKSSVEMIVVEHAEKTPTDN